MRYYRDHGMYMLSAEEIYFLRDHEFSQYTACGQALPFAIYSDGTVTECPIDATTYNALHTDHWDIDESDNSNAQFRDPLMRGYNIYELARLCAVYAAQNGRPLQRIYLRQHNWNGFDFDY